MEQVELSRNGAQPNAVPSPGALPDDLGKVARPLNGPAPENVEIRSQPISDQVVSASYDAKLEVARRPRMQPSIRDAAELKPIPTDTAGGSDVSDSNESSIQASLDVNLARGGSSATPPSTDSRLTGDRTDIPSKVQADAAQLTPVNDAESTLAVAGDYSGTLKLVRKRANVAGHSELAKTENIGNATEANATTQRPVIAGVPVGVERPDADFLKTPVKSDAKLGGAHHPRLRSLVVAGKIGEKPIDAPLRLASAASGLPRRSRRGAAAFYADAGGGLEKMFDLRRTEVKTELVKMFGGTDETEKAVKRGLTWIEKHQFEDGHWGLHEFNKCCKGHTKCNGHASVKSDVAATGFGLLPFLGYGQTHLSGAHQGTIERGIRWLVDHQQDSGELTTGKEGNSRMYSHAIGAIALCEAYGVSRDPNLREPAQLALDFIVKAQHHSSGGWRYQPNQAADTSVVGWQLMALKSGQIAGLHIPPESFALVAKWLDKVEGKGKQLGQFRYQPGSGISLAMTAEALLCRRYLGASLNDESIVQGASHLLKHLPQKTKTPATTGTTRPNSCFISARSTGRSGTRPSVICW